MTLLLCIKDCNLEELVRGEVYTSIGEMVISRSTSRHFNDTKIDHLSYFIDGLGYVNASYFKELEAELFRVLIR